MANIVYLAVLAALMVFQIDHVISNPTNTAERLSRSSVSNSLLLKRSSGRTNTNSRTTWWTWSSTEGYKSGAGYLPQENPVDQTNIPAVPTSPTVETSTTSAGSDAQQWLDAHNHWRSTYKVGALQWSEQLVNASKVLTSSCVWKHTENNKYGENMSAGQSSSKEVVDEWVTGPGEREAYSRGSNGYSHFTQVVWADTTAVGCSMTSCTDVAGSGLPQSPVKFWACEYNPAGNVIGQFDQNVKASTGGLPLA